jgi:hypothetical protein
MHNDGNYYQVQNKVMEIIIKFKSTMNTHLTKSNQNANLWTFCDHDKGIGGPPKF